MMQMPFPELHGYEVLELIGRDGAMTIWKARQLSLNRLVTVKVLTLGADVDEDSPIRFRQEAMAAAKLKNPGIVQVIDAGEFGNMAYIVMEHIPGSTLQDQLNLISVMSEEEALAIVQWVALALQYAWNEHRIIHCDIKPATIIVSESGEVRVGNLGIARVMKTMSGGAGDFVGTPNYASPEYIGGKETLDCRTDIYSLGVLFYQLVTGILPFDGLNPSAILEQQLLGHLEDPRDLDPTLSDAAAAVIHKMMSKSLADRYANWEELIEDLHDLKEGRTPRHANCPNGHSTVQLSRPLKFPPPAQLPNPAPAPAPASSPAPAAPQSQSAKKQIRVNKTSLSKAPGVKRKGHSGFLTGGLFLVLFSAGLYFGIRYTALGPVILTYRDRIAEYAGGYLSGSSSSRSGGLEKREASGSMPSAPQAPVAIRESESSSPAVSASPVSNDWKNDPDYRKSRERYQEARALYDEYTSSRQNSQLLIQAEEKSREAIELLKGCRNRLPPQAGIQPLIDQCYHLISDCHHSRQLEL